MGLDVVEMVVRVEKEFDVRIPDDVAATLITPRTVIDYLIHQPGISEQWSRDDLTLKLWFLLEDQLGISRYEYTVDSRFVEDMGAD